jgi:hypothetical protein
MTEKSTGVLAAIVNLDEEQLRTVDDEGSYGTKGDIADESKKQQQQPSGGADTSEFTSAPEAQAPQQEDTTCEAANDNYGSQQTRIKNAIFSKWKTNRLIPKRRKDEQADEGDIEASYVMFDDTISDTDQSTQTSVSNNSVTSAKVGAGAEQSSADLGLENQTVSSFSNGPHETPPPPLKLSSELFHWYIHRSWKKKLLTLLVVASSALVLHDILFCQGKRSQGVVDRFLDWMRIHPVLGIYGYIGVLAVTSCK